MNSGYVLWFGALVIVAGAAVLWLVIGSVPEIPAEPEADADPGLAGESGATLAPGPGSEPAGEDRIARPG
ncbi:MAG TPA: hypothetical protein VIK16_03990 [Candidatus Limnocylindrales bacterium]